ncbi:MAG: homoserine kinase [Rhodothermales bacterium]
MNVNDGASAWAPASISNLGPGFDAFGAALAGLGDTVSVKCSSTVQDTVCFSPDSVWRGPTDPGRNTASVAARAVAQRLGYDGGLDIEITKGLPAGTGMGSSAASCVAAAVATEALLGARLETEDMLAAVIEGEAATSGHGHADNVLPALLGGLIMMRSVSPSDYIRFEGWESLFFVVVLPEMEVLTREARTALPESIPLAKAVDHAARLGLLLNALHHQDAPSLGKWMMSDDIVVPARKHLWPHLDDVVAGAMQAGAEGCAISGSGPAVLACCSGNGADRLRSVSSAMQAACNENGFEATAAVHQIDNIGARILTTDGPVSYRTRQPIS